MSMIERAKQYNQELKQLEAKANNAKAHIDYAEKDLKRMCSELSELLGIEITEDNLEEVCHTQMQKIVNDLEVGERTIQSIKSGTYSKQETQNNLVIKEKEEEEEIERFTVNEESFSELEDTPINIGGVEIQEKEVNAGLGSLFGNSSVVMEI